MLQCNVALEPRVARHILFSHSALAEKLNDLEMRQPFPGRNGHWAASVAGTVDVAPGQLNGLSVLRRAGRVRQDLWGAVNFL